MPTVSIGMPTYNCEPYIAQSLESLLGQTYTDFELVISDNCSTDGTEGVCRKYEKLDSRIRYIRRTENIGGPGNFRYVFSQCSGKYHKWSTADDYWDKTFVAKSVAVLDADPTVVLCYPKTQLIDASGNKIEDYEDNLDLRDESPRARFFGLLDRIGLCNAHLGLIRRGAMLQTSLITGENASDVYFLAELALYGKFALLPEQLFFRRYHEQSSSWNRKSVEHQKKYYDPTGKTGFGMHTWRKYRHLAGGVWGAPISFGEKLGISRRLLRTFLWERHQLANELAALARSR
jgi:glycosyltransferase involved in cell wall biosynthesis